MPQHQIGDLGLATVDKRRSAARPTGDSRSRRVVSGDVFTANGAGTTTTIVGANAAPGTNDNNVIRRGEQFKLYNSSGVLKEETVFEVTNIAVGASTTATFAPAAAVATASGDKLRLVEKGATGSIEAMDDTLLAIAPGTYTQAVLDRMTVNDKQYAIRALQDSAGI